MLIFDSYSPLYSTSNMVSLGAVFPILQTRKLKLRIRRWLKWVSKSWSFWFHYPNSLHKQVCFQETKRCYRFRNMICKHSHFSPFEINTLSFSAGQHFLLLSGSTVLLKERNPHLSLKKGLKKPRSLPWFCSVLLLHLTLTYSV